MSVRGLLAFIDDFDRACRRREAIENAAITVAGILVVAGVIWISSVVTESPYPRIEALEQRVKALEQQIEPIEKRRDVHWPFRNSDEEQAALKKAMAERAKEAGR